MTLRALLLALAVAGCTSDAPADAPGGGATVARVGDAVLTEGDLADALGDGPTVLDSVTARDQVVEQWVQRELLVQEARRQGLDDDPGVRRQLAEAERSTLEQAALDAFFQRTPAEPTDDDLRAYYDRNRQALALREPYVRLRHLRLGNAARTAEARGSLERAVASAYPDSLFALVASEYADDPAGAAAFSSEYVSQARLQALDETLGDRVAATPAGARVIAVTVGRRRPPRPGRRPGAGRDRPAVPARPRRARRAAGRPAAARRPGPAPPAAPVRGPGRRPPRRPERPSHRLRAIRRPVGPYSLSISELRPMRLILSALLLSVAAGAAAQPVQAGARLDGIAAVVGEQVVLYSEVDALVQQSTPQGQTPPPDLWSRALDRLVDQRVVIARARQDTTLTITDDIVDQRVDAQVAQLSAQVGGDAALIQAYGRSMEEIKVSVRDDVRDELLMQQYQGRRLREVTVTPGEVREWFELIPAAERPVVPELVRVAHIVRVPSSDESGRTAIRAFADALRDSVLAEQVTLEELANRHSDDPGNTNRDGTKNGGLYTTLRLTDLEPRFQAAAAASEIGALSPVFETPFGYHVLRVNARDGNQISFNHILLQVEVGEAEAQAAREYLSVLRDSVQAGTPFEALARRHSEDPASAPRGGYVSVPQTRQRDLATEGLGPEWRATLDSLDIGEISEPAPVTLADAQQTRAFHIVLLQKKTPSHPLSIADDYSLLSQYALQQKQNEVLAQWIDGLRRTVYVDIRAERYQPPVGG